MISSEEKLWNEKLKVVAKGGIELFITMVLTTPEFQHYGPWLYVPAIYGVAALKTLFDGMLDLTLVMFALSYQLQNFIVNLIDYGFFQKRRGFYIQDDIFVSMFSHKLFQTITCFLIGFVYAQVMQPTFKFV